MIKQSKKSVPWTSVIEDPNCEEVVGTLYKKQFSIGKSNRV